MKEYDERVEEGRLKDDEHQRGQETSPAPAVQRLIGI